jgi:Ala-tRNA(Pro) deacylase
MDLFSFLHEQGIAYQRCDHPPVFTCGEANELVPPLSGAKTKNLFLRDGKGRRHFLVSLGQEKIVDLKGLAAVLGLSKLGFASARRLDRYLGLTPGAVSILGVLNDPDQRVELLVDRELWEADAFQCHPLVNTSTLVIQKPDMERFLVLTGHPPGIIDVPERYSPNRVSV